MIRVRYAQAGDEAAILELIVGLARYEKAENEVLNTVSSLADDLFKHQYCEALVAVDEHEQIQGFALFYTSYSTWKGPCIYLEDLYVREETRRSGIGDLLFDRIVEITKERGFKRLDWQVLEWNEPAIRFYEKKGALLDPEWINGRLFF